MSDLVERLKHCHPSAPAIEAAGEILRLRAEVKSARLSALQEAAAEIVDELALWNETVPEHESACFALRAIHDNITALIAQEESHAQCPHLNAIIQYTGDGSAVEYCPNCGHQKLIF